MADPDAPPAPQEETDLFPEDEDEDFGAAAPPAQGPVHLEVDPAGDGMRLDRFLALRMPALSRNRIQAWIDDGAVRRNGALPRARDLVVCLDRIVVEPRPAPEQHAFAPEAMPLAIVFEDAHILVLDKPAGLVVHPGAGNWSGTLLNGLLAHDPGLAAVPRAGIVHRLDAGTSGLMVVARSLAAQTELVRQLQARSVVREYWALVAGAVPPQCTIDAALARDPGNRLRFRVSRAQHARPARTHVRCLAQWPVGARGACVSWIACRLDTGRTHQIRVHLESIGHPLLGDPVYRRGFPAALAGVNRIGRQALHACRLQLVHPVEGTVLTWSSTPPADLRTLFLALGARAGQLAPPVAPCVA